MTIKMCSLVWSGTFNNFELFPIVKQLLTILSFMRVEMTVTALTSFCFCNETANVLSRFFEEGWKNPKTSCVWISAPTMFRHPFEEKKIDECEDVVHVQCCPSFVEVILACIMIHGIKSIFVLNFWNPELFIQFQCNFVRFLQHWIWFWLFWMILLLTLSFSPCPLVRHPEKRPKNSFPKSLECNHRRWEENYWRKFRTAKTKESQKGKIESNNLFIVQHQTLLFLSSYATISGPQRSLTVYNTVNLGYAGSYSF